MFLIYVFLKKKSGIFVKKLVFNKKRVSGKKKKTLAAAGHRLKNKSIIVKLFQKIVFNPK